MWLQPKPLTIDTTLKSLLSQKFYIADFQREYKWGREEIEAFIEDLTTTFMQSYKKEHQREEVITYKNYYMGPMVLSSESKKSIIDGQQRVTTMTLFLIYLNNLQKDSENSVYIEDLILSKKFGKETFNLTDDSRKSLRESFLKSLLEEDECILPAGSDDSVINMAERYKDIEEFFPKNLKETALPYFIDWLIEKVIIVAIEASSEQNAYTIFESMNDRGLRLSSTELLKSYVVSKIDNEDHKNMVNEIWIDKIQELHRLPKHRKEPDTAFFEAWFKAKYAKTNNKHEDFEKIAKQFHRWFQEKYKSLINLNNSDSFYKYFSEDFVFFADKYIKFREAIIKSDNKMPHLIYLRALGFAESLSEPLLLASLNISDDEDTICKKIDLVARYMEIFAIRRSIHGDNYGQSRIKSIMYNLIVDIRDNDLEQLIYNLILEVNKMDEDFSWDGISNFSLGKRRKDNRFMKHLLSRITSYIDEILGKPANYSSYQYPSPMDKKFEIEHILGGVYDDKEDEINFGSEDSFNMHRNRIGALILLPNGTNQSFGSDKYKDKLKYYIRENAYAQTLHPDCYGRNPNFLKSEKLKSLGFEAMSEFGIDEVIERSQLVERICKQIWSTDYFKE